MPDFKTIADFRKDNGPAIRATCRQFVMLCRRLDLFSEAVIAIDGSGIKPFYHPGSSLRPGSRCHRRALREPDRRTGRRTAFLLRLLDRKSPIQVMQTIGSSPCAKVSGSPQAGSGSRRLAGGQSHTRQVQLAVLGFKCGEKLLVLPTILALLLDLKSRP
jgi:hypothetical protein